MSFKNSGNLPTPKEAAARLIGFYPAINAINPEAFAAGMVALFSRYPARKPCQSPAMANGRCRMHGGTSPGAPKGDQHNHGRYSAETIARRREISAVTRAANALVKKQ
jgi:hypothetical protein